MLPIASLVMLSFGGARTIWVRPQKLHPENYYLDNSLAATRARPTPSPGISKCLVRFQPVIGQPVTAADLPEGRIL